MNKMKKQTRRSFLGNFIITTAGLILNPLELTASQKITLPEKGQINLSDKIISGGHFTWAEATKNGTRIPDKEEIVNNIIKIAYSMEDVRTYLGNHPITINSWYRDPKTNNNVNGAKNSQHLYGGAVDFHLKISPKEVYEKLNDWWGNKGGLGKYSGFTHIDCRGYKTRW